MSLDDYAKRHGLNYASPYEKKRREEEQRKVAIQAPPEYNMYANKANPLNQALANAIAQKTGYAAPSGGMVLPEETSPWKRVPTALGLGLIEGTMDLADKLNVLNYASQAPVTPESVDAFRDKGIGLNVPDTTTSKPAGVYSKQVDTLPYAKEDIDKLESKVKLEGTLAENIARGIGHETPSIVASYGTVGAATKIPAIGKFLTGSGKALETGRRGVAAGAIYTPIAEDDPTAKDYVHNMALFGAGDMAFTGAIQGIGKGISRAGETLKGLKRTPPTDIPADIPPDPGAIYGGVEINAEPLALPAPQTVEPNFTAGPYGIYRGAPRAELPGAPEVLALSSGEKPLALPGQEMKALNPGQEFAFSEGYPIEGHWFVDQYGVARGEPGTPLALPEGKAGQGSRFARQDEGAIPRSDIGDPEYLAGLEKQYNDIVATEVASMKNELGGVEIIGQNPYEMQPGLSLNDGYKRVSNNPSWYREFWQKNGRAPREGEWRDLAIKNLMEGNPETGEPASDEFLGIMSELSRGQKLPEEWHGLQKGIRDLEGVKNEATVNEPELEPLLADMKAEQAKVEPYGLERDMGRLNETENANRGRMEDKAGFRQYEGVKFKRSLALEQEKDLEVLKVVAEQRKIGPFTINKAELAPEAMERPDFKAAGEIAEKLGLRLVPFKSKGGNRGAYYKGTLYINEGITDPLDYVFLHEVTHSMQDFQPPHYERLLDLSFEHLADAEGIDRHYIRQGYKRADRPHEFAADVFAEAMSTPGFFARVAEQAPELIKPLLEAIDRLIANVKSMIDKDDTIIPYMRDWEVLRQRIRDEVAMPYFKDAMGEKQFGETLGKQLQEPAAKAKAEAILGTNAIDDVAVAGANNPKQADTAKGLWEKLGVRSPYFRRWFKDSKVVDEQGKPLAVYHGTKGSFNTFKTQYRGTTTGSDSSRLGIFFTDAKNVAETYADEALPPRARREYVNYQKNMDLYKKTGDKLYEDNARYHLNEYIRIKTYGKPGKNRIIEAYLNVKNPYIYEANGANGYDIGITEIINTAKKDGHDGVILKDIYDPAQDLGNGISNHYVVFDSTQIKSVYNRGTFDPANPDIRFKRSGKQDNLTTLEQQARERLSSRSKAKSGNYGSVDDIADLALIGAAKMQKNTDYGKWAKEMIADQGKQVEANLPYLWHRGQELIKNGKVVISDGKKEIPLSLEGATEPKITRNKQVTGDMGEIDTRSHIVSKTEREPIIAKESAKMVYTKAVDDLYRLDELDKFVVKTTGRHLSAEDKAYLLAINSREATGAARAILEENLVDAQGNIVGKSFKEVLSKIPKGKEQDFRDYLVLKNSISWMEQGKKVYPEKWGMTPEKAMQRLASYDQQTPELKQAADEYVNWHRDMAKAWLVDTGIITPEAWEAFLKAHPHYTPFQRQMKPIETTPGQGKARRGFANQTNPTKKAEGSERPIIDPIESTIEQVDRYIKTAKRNEVMQAVIRNLEKAPEELEGFAEIIPEKNATVLDDINVVLEKDGIDGVINYLEEPFEQMLARKGKAEQPLDKPNIVRAFVNGEKVHVKVNDPVLLDALTALSDTGRNAIVESFRTATRLMKVLTTGGNPIFAARNISRDIPMAYVASETLSNKPIIREMQFAWGMVDALARIVTKEKWHPDKFYQEYKAMGGGSHTASVAADRNLLAESKERVMPGYWSKKNNKPLSYVSKGARAGFQGIERFTSTVEALPRLPEYIRTVEKGGNDYASKLEGLHASQDVTVNFSRRGDISKDADAFIPYFNAAMQGIDKIARMFAKDPLAATYRSLVAVTMPTIGLYLLNKDNPNYHKLSNVIRDNYYCIPTQGGKKFVKIAKPREIGVVFSDLPERALRKWEADDPEGFYGFSEAWINNFVPPIRPIVMPIADILANKDFAGRPIVPGYMEGLSPELQYDEKTSAAAKAIGDTLKLSPKQIDYLFRSYTGFIGELGIPAMSEGRGQNARQRVGEVIKRTFTADPLYSNDVTNKFYEQKERYDTAIKDYKATGNKGEYYNPGKQQYFNRQASRISNIRKKIRKVNANPNLSYEEKEKRTRSMQADILEIAQKAIKDRLPPKKAR